MIALVALNKESQTNAPSASGASRCLDGPFLSGHVQQMVEVANRAQRYLHGGDPVVIKATSDAAVSMMESLERVVDPAVFMEACISVQKRLDKHKAEKKAALKTESVFDPRAHAMKKVCTIYASPCMYFVSFCIVNLWLSDVLYCAIFLFDLTIIF